MSTGHFNSPFLRFLKYWISFSAENASGLCPKNPKFFEKNLVKLLIKKSKGFSQQFSILNFQLLTINSSPFTKKRLTKRQPFSYSSISLVTSVSSLVSSTVLGRNLPSITSINSTASIFSFSNKAVAKL